MEKQHIPKNIDKNFRTRYDCECLEDYEYFNPKTNKNDKAKNECILDKNNRPWCKTKNKCGILDVDDNYSWDYCLSEKKSDLVHNINYPKSFIIKNIIGFCLFIIVFVLIIPYILYKNKLQHILDVYLPNFDLLATALSFQTDIFGSSYFQELYEGESASILNFYSTTIINFLSLLGIMLLVTKIVEEKKHRIYGLSLGMIMVMTTYLLPNGFITYYQNKLSNFIEYNFLSKKLIEESIRNSNNKKMFLFTLINIIIILAGVLIACLFIGVEYLMIQQSDKWLNPFLLQIFK